MPFGDIHAGIVIGISTQAVIKCYLVTLQDRPGFKVRAKMDETKFGTYCADLKQQGFQYLSRELS